METMVLDTQKMEVLPKKAKRSIVQKVVPPKGFMTGDEFEKRVKERVTKFYIENGLLQ